MPGQRYQQYCALARALDVAGDRWTLLIVRELAPGPRRFTDLLDGLPGVSRNLLTERLRALERDGVIDRRELPPPAARQVYELTDDGRDLATAMAPLMAWGARRIGDRKPSESFRARWPAVAMAGLADREAAKGVDRDLPVPRRRLGLPLRASTTARSSFMTAGPGTPPSPGPPTRRRGPTSSPGSSRRPSAAAAGSLTIAGDPQAAKRLRKIFSRRRMVAADRPA